MDRKELLDIIARAYNENATTLTLKSQGIHSLPAEIGRLINLEELSLTDNFLESLPPELWQLTQLKNLYLGKNKLRHLPKGVGQLHNLQILSLNDNELRSLPAELWQLTMLAELYITQNQLESLSSDVGNLVNLRKLSLRGNRLSHLPAEIGRLRHLQRLSIGENHLISLPEQMMALHALETLLLKGNPLSIPPEILDRTKEPQKIITYYLEQLKNQTRPLNEVKVVLVGEGSVGKTSIVNQLVYNTFDRDSQKTEGIAIHRWFLRGIGRGVHVNLWDFGGQEIMHATHQFFLTKRTLYLLIIDNRLTEAENRLDYWLTLIRSFGGDSPILVVGNKSDQHPLELDRRGLLAEHPTLQVILETSCATGTGIPELRNAIVKHIVKMPHVNDPIVTSWFEVKAKLEALDANYIPYRRYCEICREYNVGNPDSQRVLLGFLHDLGVVLHFPDPRLETTNILNPQWVTQGVYRILNTRLPFAEPGLLTWDMLARILHDEPYQEKRMFIVDMMQKFELCYELPDRPHTYLLPDLLPKEAPDTGDWRDALHFEIHYPVLPGSILTRLIVRMHRLIKERTAWRAGVLLTCDNNEALVRADLSANRITIAVRGPSSGRRELLTRIRHELENIHSTIIGLRPEEKVPIPGHPEVKPVDYQHLRTLESLGEETFIPQGLAQRVSVRYLLDGVEPPEVRRDQDIKHTTVNVYGGQVGVIGDKADVDGGIHSS